MVLDVNFPEPILKMLATFMVDITLIPMRDIDPALTDLDDRPLMLALRQEGFDWLVTNNYRMLRNPYELAGIMKARMKVFAIEAVGDDPLRGTGAVLLDLSGALRRSTPNRAEVFWSRPRNPDSKAPWDLFKQAAAHQHTDASLLYEDVKVTTEELTRPWRENISA